MAQYLPHPGGLGHGAGHAGGGPGEDFRTLLHHQVHGSRLSLSAAQDAGPAAGGSGSPARVGRCTTFKVIFSRALRASSPDPRRWTRARLDGPGTILDDEGAVRAVATDMIRSMGFEVISAEDGLQALERYRECPVPIRAVLMDLTMPRMDGLETFRELRRLDPGCRVVLTSGYNEQEAIQDFLGKGLAAFVQKPFLREDLLKALRRALET
ncbi:MAG: response regulator [Holophagaceae bacterium]